MAGKRAEDDSDTGNGAENSEEGPEPEVKEEMIKALPEDIIAVVQNWTQIKSRLTSTRESMVNTIMVNSSPKAEDGKLVIALKDGIDVGAMLMRDKDEKANRKLLVEKIISEEIGKSVEVIFKAPEQLKKDAVIDLDDPSVIEGINMLIEQID